MPSLLGLPLLALAAWLQSPEAAELAAPSPAEAAETAAEETSLPADGEPHDPLEAPEPASGRPLDRGLAALEQLDLDVARTALDEAAGLGPYSYAECVALFSALGVVRAYLGDEAGARAAFEKLLAIAPGHSLAYTTSPKATFLFEEVRTAYQTRRATELRLSPPSVVPFGVPVEIEIERSGDPLHVIARVEVRYRLKGEKAFERRSEPAPEVGRRLRVALPPLEEADGFTDEQGQVGALYEIALSGYDVHGWEVFVGPTDERPIEVPVGFDAPGPLYTRWWVWALGGAGVALVTAAAATVTGASVAAVVLWPPPTTVPATTVIREAAPGHSLGGRP